MAKDAAESKNHSFIGLGIAVGVAVLGVLLLLLHQAMNGAPGWPYSLFLLFAGLLLWG